MLAFGILIGYNRYEILRLLPNEFGTFKAKIMENTHNLADSPKEESEVRNQIHVEELLGSLRLDVDASVSSSASWLFLDGHLIQSLPLHRTVRVLPGTYEVRVVSAGVEGFPVRVETASVARGTCVTISGLDKWQDATATAKFIFPWSDSVYQLNCESGDNLQIELEADCKRIQEDQDRVWDAFTEGELWEPISEALAYTRLTRNFVWMELPWELGGPREMDVAQLVSLREFFQKRVPSSPVTILAPRVDSSQRQVVMDYFNKNVVQAGRRTTRREFDLTFAQLQRNLSHQQTFRTVASN